MANVKRLVWFDLTAGDGLGADDDAEAVWWRLSSPGLLAYYAAQSRKDVLVNLYEINVATFERLLDNLAHHLPELDYTRIDETTWRHERVLFQAIRGSGRDARVDLVRPGDAVMVLNDPNAITEWAMRPSFLREIREHTWLCRAMCTLGCNVNGIKRRPLQEREQWFGYINQMVGTLPQHLDIALAVIDKDDSQWAYALTESPKWRSGVQQNLHGAFKSVERTVTVAWYRKDPELFEEQCRVLFFTKVERKELGL